MGGVHENSLSGSDIEKIMLCDLYTSPDVVTMIESRKLRQAEHVARRENYKTYKSFVLTVWREEM